MWFRRIFSAKPARPAENSARPNVRSGAAMTVLSTQAQRQLNRLQLRTGRALPGQRSGQRPSLRRKLAMDFREHRMYTPGDDARFVDWKASARQEHIFVRQGEQPKDADIYVLLDTSASMAWGQPPRSQAALALAAALAYLALAAGDRLVVVPFHGQSPAARSAIGPPLGPVSGKGQFSGVLQYLRGLPFRNQIDLNTSLYEFSRRYAGRGGMVLILSDLFDAQDLRRGLEGLSPPAWEVVVFHLLHPAELDPPLQGGHKLQDIETGQTRIVEIDAPALQTYRQRLQAWQQDLEMACVDKKAFYTLIPTGWSLENEILPHLREKGILVPL